MTTDETERGEDDVFRLLDPNHIILETSPTPDSSSKDPKNDYSSLQASVLYVSPREGGRGQMEGEGRLGRGKVDEIGRISRQRTS